MSVERVVDTALIRGNCLNPLVLLQTLTDNRNLRGFIVLNIWFIIEYIHVNYHSTCMNVCVSGARNSCINA